jgi:CO/xanthine dehydrogenase Mo-binding subunit
VAQWRDARLSVWTASQGVYALRADLARAFGIAPESITVQHVQGPGCYGHNGADDAAFEAAVLARAVDGPAVRLQWSREEELGWEPFGPASVVALEADVDDVGTIVGWRHDFYGNGHNTRPGSLPRDPSFLVAPLLENGFERIIADDAKPYEVNGGGRNSVPIYDVGALRVVGHWLEDMPIRTSSLRSLGAFVNVFAIESFMDELATEAAVDPVEYRLRHLRDPRARSVVEAAARRAGWGEPLPEGRGRGIGFARYKNTAAYCAVVAEVEAVDDLRVRRLAITVDAGMVVNPDGLVNQIEGGATQSLSWTHTEQVRFDRTRVTSNTWEQYPILRFSDVPPIDVALIDRPELPSLGVGEAAQGPVPAAVANALFAAVGVRVRDLPLTRERIAVAAGAP